MATLTQIKTKANTKLLDFWVVLSQKQEQYFQRYGGYFQLLQTTPVVDGLDTTFVLTLPNDQQPRSKNYTFDFVSPIPFQINVDCFGNDTVQGYTMSVIVELTDGRRFTRSRTLTDTRKLTKDVTATDENGFPTAFSEPYAIGNAPTLETTQWQEIIEITL